MNFQAERNKQIPQKSITLAAAVNPQKRNFDRRLKTFIDSCRRLIGSLDRALGLKIGQGYRILPLRMVSREPYFYLLD